MLHDHTAFFEKIWHEKVGSSRLTEDDELKRINYLNNTKKISFAQARNLFYMTKFWKRMRIETLNRDGNKCVQCGAVDNLQVDHLTYRGIGNERLEDLQTLCVYCHKNKTPEKTIVKARNIFYSVSDKDELFMIRRKKDEVQL